MTRLYAGSAVLFILALLGAIFYFVVTGHSSDPYAACREGKVAAGSAAIGGPFTLVNQDGKTVTDKDVLAKPSLVYFGYTFCPDICPLDNTRNAEAVDILEEQGFDVTPVFISIDPKRDTPKVMKEYVAAMHPKMIGLTGTPEQVKAAAQAYKVYYKVQDPTQANYLFDHSTFTYLMLPGKGFVDFFRGDVTPDKMAERVSCFLDAS